MPKIEYYVRHASFGSEYFRLEVDAKNWALRQSELLQGRFTVYRAFDDSYIVSYQDGQQVGGC